MDSRNIVINDSMNDRRMILKTEMVYGESRFGTSIGTVIFSVPP